MITIDTFRKLALSFPGSEEHPHFDKSSFRFKKKIFATLWEKENKVMIKLPLAEQSVYCTYDPQCFSPVHGAWGKQGCTFVELKMVKKKMLEEALSIAFTQLSR